MKGIFLFAFMLLAATVVAECPNGCSGAGKCGAKDMCTCHKNYQGNDCSQRTCPNGYAHVDIPKGDLDMDRTRTSAWGLLSGTPQVYPEGTYEYYNPGAQTGEGHFYAECSNNGLCDRETGTCVCFENYSGNACQRTVCPNDCNGHGTCESISELATTAAGTLFHKGTDTGDTTYALWDKKTSYGCKCDPRFYGPDCSQRRCKVGVDPLYSSIGTEVYETISIRVAAVEQTPAPGPSTSQLGPTSWIRITFFDYWGEAYITDRIVMNVALLADTITSIADALKALPNNVINDVTCENAASTILVTGTRHYEVPDYTIADSDAIYAVCQFKSNPGKLRLPKISEYSVADDLGSTPTLIVDITGTFSRGENTDLAMTVSAATVSEMTIGASFDMTLSATPEFATSNVLMKVLGQYFLATTVATTTVTMAYESHLAVTAASTEALYYSTEVATEDTDTVDAVAIGSFEFTMTNGGGGVITSVVPGNVLFFENQFFVAVAVEAAKITVDRPFYGKSLGTGPTVSAAAKKLYYWTTWPTVNTYEYVSECSGRGLCDGESGLCSCFKGYSNDNCDTQNTMAF